MSRKPQISIDPARHAQVREEQEELRRQYATHITMARLCPYCEHKIEVLCKGSHGASFVKCPKCSESVFFPPVVFRTLPGYAYKLQCPSPLIYQHNFCI